MAQLNFNQIETTNNQNNENGVGFFKLKNDGDEAIVRIMHDSVDSFDIVSKHVCYSGNRIININCVRTPNDPIDACPLCASGEKLENKIYIHMIQYVTNETGNVTAIPVVWERSLSYASQLKSFIDEYGPLSNCIFKIKRHGAAGSRDTKYSMLFCNPSIYNESIYIKNVEAFNGYRALGRAVFDKTADEIKTFIVTGEFPKKEQNIHQQNQFDVPSNANSVNTANAIDNDQVPFTGPNPYQQPMQYQYQNQYAQPNQQVQKPIRYY